MYKIPLKSARMSQSADMEGSNFFCLMTIAIKCLLPDV